MHSQLIVPVSELIAHAPFSGQAIASGDDLDSLHIYLTPALIQRVASEMFGPRLSPFRLRDVARTRDDDVLHLLRSLAMESASPEAGAHVMVQSLTRQLAVRLIRRHAEQVPEPDATRCGFDIERCQLIARFLASNLAEDLSVAVLARREGLSVARYNRLFRHSFQCSPHQHVMQARIDRACELLAVPSLSLADIAAETGFADQSHLTRCFKRRFGVPPRQWRSQRLEAA
jgi:AraC family transcriptional regulator